MSTATEVKHTAGPWFVRGSYVETDVDGGNTICQVSDWLNEFREEQEANADLIAAAPDMLSALECAANVLGLLKDEANALGFNANKVLPKVQDAIRKARGGQ